MNRFLRFVSLWAPVVFWCVLIYLLSDIPDLGTGLAWDLPLRKSGHLVEYAILSALLWRALHGSGARSVSFAFWCSFGFSVLYAASDEFHQGFVPGRYPSFLDFLIDGCGAALAALYLRRRGTAV